VPSIAMNPAPPFAVPARSTAIPAPRSRVVLPAIAAAWFAVIVAQLTGSAGLLHHHALIEGSAPLWLGAALFLAGWLVMVGAMMLPASLSTLRLVERRSVGARRPGTARGVFVAGFLLAWTAFGLLAFAADDVLHHVVDATPWLASRPWLIEASLLALAGGYQFVPLKQNRLAACRHPGGRLPDGEPSEPAWFRSGLDHGLDCLGSSWTLMLVMFAEGFANLPWMAGLTALMVYEAGGRHGPRASRLAGIVLLLAGLAVLSGPVPRFQ
jgi:predicted metal-binding membrane protein